MLNRRDTARERRRKIGEFIATMTAAERERIEQARQSGRRLRRKVERLEGDEN